MREISAKFYFYSEYDQIVRSLLYVGPEKRPTYIKTRQEAAKLWETMTGVEKAPYQSLSEFERGILKSSGQWSRSGASGPVKKKPSKAVGILVF
jgi:hypothetical protein